MRYSCAVAATGLAILMGFFLEALLQGRFPLLTLFPMVILTALLAGFGPGCLAVLLGATAVTMLWLAPRYTIFIHNFGDAIAIAFFSVISIGLCAIIEYLHRTRHRLALSQEQLVQSESRLHTFLDSLPSLCWVADPSGKVIWYNRRWREYTGHDPSEPNYLGRVAVHPDDLPKVLENWSRAFSSSLHWEDTFRLRRHDGAFRHFLSRAVAVLDATGTITQWIGTNVDVEEQLENQRAIAQLNRDLQNRVDEFDTLIQVIPVGIGMALDKDCRTIRINRAFSEIIGVGEKENASMSAPEGEGPKHLRVYADGKLLQPEDMPLQIAAREGRMVRDFSLDIVQPDGTRARLLAYAAPLMDGAGNPRGSVAAFVDLSARMEAEERFRLLADAAPVMVWIANTNRACTWFNRAWVEFVGRPMEMLVGDGWAEDVHPDDRERCMKTYTTAFNAMLPFSMEYRLRRGDGEYRWLLDHGRPLYEGPSKEFSGYIGSCIDISDLKRLEAERSLILEAERTARMSAESARREAEHASRMKDEFLATLSHELRTPLNAILGWLEVLRSQQRTQDDLASGLEIIERNAHVQAQLVEDLLDMSRIISGRLHLETRLEPIAPIIEAALTTVLPAANAKQVRIETELSPQAMAHCDATRLQQVVWNLLSNAVKFTPTGGLISVRLSENDEHVIVRVSDTGQGIPSEFLPYVFDRFRQADSSSTRRYGGLGLGLSIVRHLTELHGGTIHVHSDGPGLGATFTLLLPLPSGERREMDSGISGDANHASTPG